MIELVIILIGGIMWLVMFFAVLRIKNETVALAALHRRLLVLVEAVVPENKKPKPAPRPTEIVVDGVLVRVCPKCGGNNSLQDARCAACEAVLLA